MDALQMKIQGLYEYSAQQTAQEDLLSFWQNGLPEKYAQWLLMGFAVFAIDIRGHAIYAEAFDGVVSD
jgi:cephalosporin-C deacetylase-like acetyl esterase